MARAVEWIIEHPLTRVELARVHRRVIDGVEHHVASRVDESGAVQVLGSWRDIATADFSVLALYYEATGDHPYGDEDIPLHVGTMLPLPTSPESAPQR